MLGRLHRQFHIDDYRVNSRDIRIEVLVIDQVPVAIDLGIDGFGGEEVLELVRLQDFFFFQSLDPWPTHQCFTSTGSIA